MGEHVAETPEGQVRYSNWLDRVIHLDPLLLRGFLLALAGILAQVLGITVIDNELIDAIINLFTAVSAFIVAVWARPAVTANARVIAFKRDPEKVTSPILPGEATVREVDINRVVDAARYSSKAA